MVDDHKLTVVGDKGKAEEVDEGYVKKVKNVKKEDCMKDKTAEIETPIKADE